MGFIKSIQKSVSGQYNDQFREVVRWDDKNPNTLIKKVTTENGVITDKSRLFVNPGECAIFADNGAIKDIITEPGMYFMDTSSPSLFQTNIFKGIGENFLESMKRIAYKGDTITEQAVYFISLQEVLNLNFNTINPILYKDPEWGPIEIKIGGTYAFKVTNPVNLITNVSGPCEEFNVQNVVSTLTPFVISGITSEVASLNISFDSISKEQSELGKELVEKISKKIESLGIELTKITVTTVDVAEEIKKSMRERTAIKMKATSVDDKQADIYTKLNKAEALKDMANNQNSAGATIMGMNMGNMFSGMIDSKDDKDNK